MVVIAVVLPLYKTKIPTSGEREAKEGSQKVPENIVNENNYTYLCAKQQAPQVN